MVVPDRGSILGHLTDPRFVEVEVAGHTRSFVVERTRPDAMHACTVDDLVQMLESIDPAHLVGLDLFVLRQPTRKEETLAPVWGGLRYYLEIGRHAGGALLLNAISDQTRIRFDRRMTPDQSAELDRLRTDGADITETNRSFDLTFDPVVARRVQLYRTLLHEIGHWVDYLTKVELPSDLPDGDWAELWDRYWQRPHREREAFAHRYADETGLALVAADKIPFDRRTEPERMLGLGLRPGDFALTQSL